MKLQGDLKKGVIKNFNSTLSDGSLLSATIIIRDEEKGDKLEKVRYTICKICEESDNPAPIWQIRALKSNRNIKEGIISNIGKRIIFNSNSMITSNNYIFFQNNR